jgi:SAM-dependent methyltransferase
MGSHGPIASAARRLLPRSQPLRLSAEQFALLRCPQCQRTFAHKSAKVVCGGGHSFPVVEGVPVFTDAGRAVEVRPTDHASHQANPRIRAHFAGARDWLHLGAGATGEVLPGSIELETAVFVHTHVVGDVHHLPFADGVLGGVLALNVFEHLEDPERAAAELHRVLRPGAPVLIQTAFLQPLHADPYHYYNTTEVGLRRWFRDFRIEAVDVPGNFNPAFSLGWFCSELLHYCAEDDRQLLAATTIEELSAFWRDPSTRDGPLHQAFERLPDIGRRVLAAGFELTARR